MNNSKPFTAVMTICIWLSMCICLYCYYPSFGLAVYQSPSSDQSHTHTQGEFPAIIVNRAADRNKQQSQKDPKIYGQDEESLYVMSETETEEGVYMNQCTKPEFCRNHLCPNFTVTTYPLYQSRTYPSFYWANINITGRPFKLAQKIGLERLNKYFGGDNVNQTKINVTVPYVYVISKAENLYPNISIYVWIPQSFQADPPQPHPDSEIALTQIPESTLYVHSFGGFPTKDVVYKNLLDHQWVLQQNGIQFNQETFALSLYDEPWNILNRHNELWLFGPAAAQKNNTRN